MELSETVAEVMSNSALLAVNSDEKFVTEEMFVYTAITLDKNLQVALNEFGCNVDKVKDYLREILDISEDREKVRENIENGTYVRLNQAMEQAVSNAMMMCNEDDNSEFVEIADILFALYADGNDVIKYIGASGLDINQFDDFICYYYKLIEDERNSMNEHDKGQQQCRHQNPFAGVFGGNELKFEDYCTDLLENAKKHKEPVVGREHEIDITITALCRKEKNNVIYVGEAGVGKTALSVGLAKKIISDNVPSKLKGCEFYSLDIGSLMAGTRYRGDLEERLKFVMDTLKEKEKVIVFIDEIHMLLGGGSDNSMNLANLIKTSLTESNIRFIGATTYDEYKKHVESDNAFARRFKSIDVLEPSPKDTKEIISGVIQYYEEFHNVKYTPEAINASVDLTVKYINDKFLPDKAFDIIDEAGAYLSKSDNHGIVDKKLIEKIISKNCRIPQETVTVEDNNLIFSLEDKLKSKVFGQDKAIEECVKAIKLSRAGLLEENKPVANLLFVGQTGVGKTEIARQMADALNIDFIKFDMSEYADQTSVNKLIGASSGYVGYEDGGVLVEQVRKHPHCVLLLDEIEKAHPSVFNVLLQVMDDAKLTDNKGRKADFKNVIIIMTSNAGASNTKHTGLGFNQSDSIDLKEIDKAVEKTFTPEFRNRLTKIVVLNNVDNDMARSIAKKMLDELKFKLNKKNIHLQYTSGVVDYCVKHGVSEEFGARPIIRLINDDIKMLLVDDILANSMSKCKLSVKNDKIVVTK